MKDYISYYFGLDVEELVFTGEKYLFISNNCFYIFKPCDNLKINLYYKNFDQNLQFFKYFSNIVLNINKDLVTLIDNKYYVLLKINKNINMTKVIDVLYINNDMFIQNDTGLIELCRFPWISFWEKKIDYLENWIFNKKDKYRELYPIIHFFIGLSENALLYLKETLRTEEKELCDRLTIQHDRINHNTYLYDYYDPTTVVFDHSSRDISEYFKSLWNNGIFDYEMFEKYLDSINVSKYWIRIMYSRILFPSFFFDYVEKSVINKNNSDLSYLETKMNDFQHFLNKIGTLLSKKYGIEYLNWNKNNC